MLDINKDDASIVVMCDCYSLDHLMRMTYFRNDPKMIYVDTLFESNRSWWWRVKKALAYLFKRNVRYCLDDLVIREKQANELIAFMQQYLCDNDNYWERMEAKNDKGN